MPDRFGGIPVGDVQPKTDKFGGVAVGAIGAKSAQSEKPGFMSRLGTDISGKFSEGSQQVREGENQMFARDSSIGQRLGGAGKTALGAIGQATSPISGASKAIVGDPIRAAIPGRAGRLIGDTAELGAGFAGPGMIGKAGKTAGEVARTAEQATAGATKAREAAKVADAEIPKTTDSAKNIAGYFYKKADQEGGTLMPSFTDRFLDSAKTELPQTTAGIATQGESEATKLIKRYEDSIRGQPMSLQAAQEVDEGLGKLITRHYGPSGLTAEGRDIAQIQSKFRESLDNVDPKEVDGGKNGLTAWKQGQKAWSQAAKMRDIENIKARAEVSENPDKTMQSGIRALLGNPRRIRGWDEAEKAALKQSIKTLTLDNVLKITGSRLSGLVGAIAGHGLPGAAAGHGISAASRAISSSRQMQRTDELMKTLGRGIPKKPALGGVESLGGMEP